MLVFALLLVVVVSEFYVWDLHENPDCGGVVEQSLVWDLNACEYDPQYGGDIERVCNMTSNSFEMRVWNSQDGSCTLGLMMPESVHPRGDCNGAGEYQSTTCYTQATIDWMGDLSTFAKVEFYPNDPTCQPANYAAVAYSIADSCWKSTGGWSNGGVCANNELTFANYTNGVCTAPPQYSFGPMAADTCFPHPMMPDSGLKFISCAGGDEPSSAFIAEIFTLLVAVVMFVMM